jgi:very-short-patch-repair endonuclease
MPRERRLPQPEGVKLDARIAQRAARQWSIVDLDDLRACGLTQQAVAKRVDAGRLFPFHRGVWSVVPNPTLEGCFLAAVKACGWGSGLSHYAGAALLDWVVWDGRDPEVTSPTLRRHPGIRTHRCERVELMLYKGIPITLPARIVADLAGSSLPLDRLRRAVNEGLNQRRIRPLDLVISGRRGAKRLRAILATAAPTRNEYEDIVLAVLTQAGLPMPEVNRRRAPYFPDFRWPAWRVVLEADSVQFHDHLLARADDSRRQAQLEARGDVVLRTTWREVMLKPEAVVRRVWRAFNGASVDFHNLGL